jgi:hypothetical protein
MTLRCLLSLCYACWAWYWYRRITEDVAGIAYRRMLLRLTGHGTELVSWLEAQAMACTVSEWDDRMRERGTDGDICE